MNLVAANTDNDNSLMEQRALHEAKLRDGSGSHLEQN